MRNLLIAALLLAAPALALAQTEQKPSPDMQALGATVMDLTDQNVKLRSQLIQAYQHAADLQKQIDALRTAAKSPQAPADQPAAK